MSHKDLLNHPVMYRLWQAPFARQKLRPLRESGVLERAKSVLDVGCGPGTNSSEFSTVQRYVGVDISERYIAYAAAHYRGDFRVVDVTAAPPGFGRFDLILMNSLMHHLDDQGSRMLLASLPPLLEQHGEVHIIDLVLAESGVRRRLALADRGAFARSVDDWARMIDPILNIVEMRSFDVGLGALGLWELIYVRATAQAEPRP